MEITFQTTKDDWAKAAAEMPPNIPKRPKLFSGFLFWTIAFLLFLIIYLSLGQKGPARYGNIIFAGPILCIMIAIALIPLFIRMVLKGKKWVRVSPGLLKPMTVGITESHYYSRTEFEECKREWVEVSGMMGFLFIISI